MQLPIKAAKTIIEASSVASAIIGRSGDVLYVNRALLEWFPEAKAMVPFAELFDSQPAVADLLQKATRGSSSPHALLNSVTNKQPFSVRIVPLDVEDGSPASLYLATISGRSIAQQKMAALKQQVEEAAVQRRRLLERNRALTNTVNSTIPKLRALSFTDSLTQLHNRRFYDSQLEREWLRSQRGKDSLSLIFLDIDHFKLYNDTHGHPMGDECLKKVANALRTYVNRRFDFVCRIGGEEFALVLPMTDADGANEVAKRALSVIEEMAIPLANGKFLTMSAGVGTCVPHRGQTLSDFIQKVDQALYRSKHAGRNRVTNIDVLAPRDLESQPDQSLLISAKNRASYCQLELGG